jgi:transcriptional regulator with XRE-family HTH domain
MDAVSFGKYISKLRIQAGFDTQAALGKAAGVESSTISRIETGDTKNPNIETLRKLAPFLKKSHVELMDMAGYSWNPEDVESIIKDPEKINSLDQITIERLQRYASAIVDFTDENEENKERLCLLRQFLEEREKIQISLAKKDFENVELTLEEQQILDQYKRLLRTKVGELYEDPFLLGLNTIPEESVLITEYRQLPPLSQQAVMDMVKRLKEINKANQEQSATNKENEVS